MNEIFKVVFSDSLGVRRVGRDDDRRRRERSDGYLLAHGGARLARSLVETGLTDEYRLLIHPAILGAGERIFTAPLTIEPMSATAATGERTPSPR